MYRGRFAPSPTGPLHFGSLVAAVASYVDARANGGEWLLRIDDIDAPRSSADATRDIIATLSRYGFRHDGPIVHQRDRLPRYELALRRLCETDRVFPCSCSRRSLESAAVNASGERVYPGTCRRGAGRDDGPLAWRFKVDAEPVAFVDRLQGRLAQRLDVELGDFTLKRADGLFAYQLAVVVDDAEALVTDVVRGIDLLASTPRQIALQQALGFATPRYLHVPIAVDGTGAKLSKQTHAAPLPHDPLPTLAKAWRFLDQQPFAHAAGAVEAFWHGAWVRWDARRLPPVAMLPAL